MCIFENGMIIVNIVISKGVPPRVFLRITSCRIIIPREIPLSKYADNAKLKV